MGLPGVHSKFWLHQSSVAVSYLPYQPLHFTTLHWSGPSSPEVQLLIPSNDLSLLCACGRTCRSIHLPIIHLLTYPSVHPPIQPLSYSVILLSIYPLISSTLRLNHPSIHSSIHLLIYSSTHSSNHLCTH